MPEMPVRLSESWDDTPDDISSAELLDHLRLIHHVQIPSGRSWGTLLRSHRFAHLGWPQLHCHPIAVWRGWPT